MVKRERGSKSFKDITPDMDEYTIPPLRGGSHEIHKVGVKDQASSDPGPKVDKHQLQGWYSQAISAANQLFHIALDGRMTRRRLLDISETLESLAARIGRAAGNAD